MRYESPPTTVSEQLTLLRERGMEIKDVKKARGFLSNVGYYRFTGYALHFEHFENRKRTHRFKESTSWSRVYSSLKSQQVKKELAQYFGLSPYILKSWIHALTVLRNSCAHHARIWNASLTIKPEFTKRMDRYFTRNSLKRDRIVSLIYITGELLKPLGKYNTFIDRINGLFRAHPNVPYDSMGLNRKLFDYYV